MKRSVKRIGRLILVMAGVLLVVVGLPLRSHYLAKGRVERYKAQLRAKGEKLTIDELTRAYPK